MQETELKDAVTGYRIGKSHFGDLMPALLWAAGYYCATDIGFALKFQNLSVPILWPPNAVLLAGLLSSPPPSWRLILLAVFPAHLAAQWHSGVSVETASIWFICGGGEAVLGAACVRGMLGQHLRLDSLRHAMAFLLCCVFLAPFASTFPEVALVRLLGEEMGGFWRLWSLRFLSKALATLIVVPVLLAWNADNLQFLRRMPSLRKAEVGLLVAVLLGLGSVVMWSGLQSVSLTPLLLFAPLPVCLWSALRFDLPVTSLSLLLLTGLILTLVSGPFDQAYYGASALFLQLFVMAVSVPLLLLSAAVQELRQSPARECSAGLRRANELLNEAIAGRHEAQSALRQAEAEVRNQREQLTRLTRVAALGKLSGALAHELNQPLAALLTNAQAARRSMRQLPVDLHELNEILSDIVNEGMRASEVIRRLRAFFVKGETGIQVLEINGLVRDTLKIAHCHLMECKVDVTQEFALAPCLVRGDRVQLQQVLLNLIVNACEAMSSAPSATRRLKLAADAQEEGCVHIAVADTGPGIEPDVIDKVFDAFFTTKAHGMGFGLSISRAIIAEHHGRIEATNNPDGGATFRITLPVCPGGLS